MKKSVFRSDFKALGTEINIQIVVGREEERNRAKDDAEEVKKLFFEKQKIFDRFDSRSELSRLNKELGHFQNVSEDMLYLVSRALYYNKISGGLYDPRIIGFLEQIGYKRDFRSNDFSNKEAPSKFKKFDCDLEKELSVRNCKVLFSRRMDLSGIAKGYITDCAADLLCEKEWKNFLVDSGGDMRIAGKNSEGKRWRIAVEGISEEKMMLEIENKGIATSGISRKKWRIGGKKFHHLVNPQKPNFFSFDLRTVSVIAENTEEADGRAKTLMLMGKDKGMEFSKEHGIASIFLDYKSKVYVSPEAEQYILNIK